MLLSCSGLWPWSLGGIAINQRRQIALQLDWLAITVMGLVDKAHAPAIIDLKKDKAASLAAPVLCSVSSDLYHRAGTGHYLVGTAKMNASVGGQDTDARSDR
jgi:hypothetical protein